MTPDDIPKSILTLSVEIPTDNKYTSQQEMHPGIPENNFEVREDHIQYGQRNISFYYYTTCTPSKNKHFSLFNMFLEKPGVHY